MVEWVVLLGALICLSSCLVVGRMRRFEMKRLGAMERLGYL